MPNDKYPHFNPKKYEFLALKNMLNKSTLEEKHKYLSEYIEVTKQNIKFIHYLFDFKNFEYVEINLKYKK